MKYLSELTPAEVLVVTNENVTQRELLKITFIDLLLKQVLKTFEVERQPHSKEEVRVYQYVGIGQNYKTYNSHNYERLFLSTFGTDDTFEILFSNLVKIAYQKSKTVRDLKNDVIKTPTLKKCFTQNIFQKIYYGYSFTEYGTEVKRKVKKEIQDLGNELSGISTMENQKVIELIKIIGANIFLVVNIDSELLNQIDQDFGTEINRINSGDGASGCSGCGWSFDDHSSGSVSGCSGDSGGSGCSGCGGCGGD